MSLRVKHRNFDEQLYFIIKISLDVRILLKNNFFRKTSSCFGNLTDIYTNEDFLLLVTS